MVVPLMLQVVVQTFAPGQEPDSLVAEHHVASPAALEDSPWEQALHAEMCHLANDYDHNQAEVRLVPGLMVACRSAKQVHANCPLPDIVARHHCLHRRDPVQAVQVEQCCLKIGGCGSSLAVANGCCHYWHYVCDCDFDRAVSSVACGMSLAQNAVAFSVEVQQPWIEEEAPASASAAVTAATVLGRLFEESAPKRA